MFRKYIYLVLGFGVLLIGCDKDFLETKIDIYETPESISTNRTSMTKFANAFYAVLPYGFTELDNNLIDVISDDAEQSSNAVTNSLVFTQGRLNPNNINFDIGDRYYKRMYEGIRAANFFLKYSVNYEEFLLKNLDTLFDNSTFEKEKQSLIWYRAEAHIALAFYYFELAKRYGGVPIIEDIYEEVGNVPVKRASFDETIDYIISKIDDYKDSLQTDWINSNFANQDGRFTYPFALALKSRVLLYAASPLHNPDNDIEKWKSAAEAAHEVIQLNKFSLANDYGSYLNGDGILTSQETIFAVRRPANNSFEKANYPVSTPGGNSGISPTENLVSSYEYIDTPDPENPYKNRDPRLSATIVANGSTWNGRTIDMTPGGQDDLNAINASKTGYYLRKFLKSNLNLTQNEVALHPWIVFRYGEILLNYAEAMNEAYGPNNDNGYGLTARQAINMIRDRASNQLSDITSQSKGFFRIDIQKERRIELAFEGHRYWDLLRWKLAKDVLNKPILGVSITMDNTGKPIYTEKEVVNRIFDERMYLFPFSYNEIANSNGIIKQNPGYE